MKSPAKSLFAVISLALGTGAFAQEATKPVAVNTDGMPQYLRARIEAKAQEGPTALIRYVNRTRNMHLLRVEDIVKAVLEPSAVAQRRETVQLSRAAETNVPK